MLLQNEPVKRLELIAEAVNLIKPVDKATPKPIPLHYDELDVLAGWAAFQLFVVKKITHGGF